MNFFKNIKISAKIWGGFGCIIFLLLTIGVTGIVNLNSGKDDFKTYRTIALQTNQAGRVQANLLEARLAVKNFIINSSDSNIAVVNERVQKTLDLNTAFVGMVKDPERLSIIRETDNELKSYIDGFDKVARLQAKRDDLVTNSLDVIGPQIERKLTAIMQSAYEDKDSVAAFYAGRVQRSLLLMRLYATKFLVTNEETAFARVTQEAEEMKKQQAIMLKELNNRERRKLAEEAEVLEEKYLETFNMVHSTIKQRNDLITNTLDKIGPKVAKEFEDLKLMIKNQQDILGPHAEASSERAVHVTIVTALFSLFVGGFAAWVIGRSISVPISAITSAMNSLAGGNKEQIIPGLEHKDEVGSMAAAVQIFKENMIKNDELQERQRQAEEDERKRAEEAMLAEQSRLEAERAREQAQAETDRQRTEQLQAAIADFEAQIGALLASVEQSSSELKAASDTMRQISTDSDTQSMQAASASSQASSNVSSVAAASEEMAASVQEISIQVAKSSDMTNLASDKAQETNLLVQELANNVTKIDDVVKMINDIAEQTNLLALNATIEAARAGAAGAGFAVVASEVKTLANQTGKATTDIQTQIGIVQKMSQQASSGMQEMVAVFQQTSEIAGSIASAVEEQNASTMEISQSAGEAANGTDEVAANISQLRDGVQSASNASEQVSVATETLGAQSEQLSTTIEQFLKDIERIQAS